MAFARSSRARLTAHDLDRFPGTTLLDRVGRAVCRAACLPRKELYESWEVARRVRRLFRGGRIVDLGGGHGLLAQIMLILDDSSPGAVVVDTHIPPSAARLANEVLHDWPRLASRVRFASRDMDAVELSATDVIVSCHACGALTDRVLERAVSARARVAVLPCCHDIRRAPDAADLASWVDGALAMDIARALKLKQHGFRVWTQTIPAAVTPRNRLLIGAPSCPPSAGLDAVRSESRPLDGRAEEAAPPVGDTTTRKGV